MSKDVTHKELAKIAGVTPEWVLKTARKHNVKYTRVSKDVFSFSEKAKRDLLGHFMPEGYTSAIDIAKSINSTSGWVSKVGKNLGLTPLIRGGKYYFRDEDVGLITKKLKGSKRRKRRLKIPNISTHNPRPLDLFDADEIAKKLDIHRNAVYARIKNRKIKPDVFHGKVQLYSADKVDQIGKVKRKVYGIKDLPKFKVKNSIRKKCEILGVTLKEFFALQDKGLTFQMLTDKGFFG